ncbi:unnamed protein product [Trichogramma brassicae]|uniref:Uncharacterized protein n=1 Tax=Trichogramma brassicae TaxID=86971 RepID=A0A6H5HV38_9HYME|nr:unnamed protein product [Trichogramma brassicae]
MKKLWRCERGSAAAMLLSFYFLAVASIILNYSASRSMKGSRQLITGHDNSQNYATCILIVRLLMRHARIDCIAIDHSLLKVAACTHGVRRRARKGESRAVHRSNATTTTKTITATTTTTTTTQMKIMTAIFGSFALSKFVLHIYLSVSPASPTSTANGTDSNVTDKSLFSPKVAGCHCSHCRRVYIITCYRRVTARWYAKKCTSKSCETSRYTLSRTENEQKYTLNKTRRTACTLLYLLRVFAAAVYTYIEYLASNRTCTIYRDVRELAGVERSSPSRTRSDMPSTRRTSAKLAALHGDRCILHYRTRGRVRTSRSETRIIQRNRNRSQSSASKQSDDRSVSFFALVQNSHVLRYCCSIRALLSQLSYLSIRFALFRQHSQQLRQEFGTVFELQG